MKKQYNSMKKFSLTVSLVLVLMTLSFSQTAKLDSPTSITGKVFQESVEDKIEKMQKFIGFDDVQAEQLREVELNFLLDVQKAETCFLCNEKKRIKKLIQKRDHNLQEILTRKQYIEYEGGDLEVVKKYPVRVE